MNAVLALAQEMFVLLAIGLIGFVMRKANILPKESNYVLTQVVLYITLPCLIIYSMDITMSLEIMVEITWLLSLSLFALFCATITGYVMRKTAKMPENQEGVYEAAIIFGNQGFLGYAIAFLLFGEIGVLYTAFFMIFFLFYVWTYVIYVVARAGQTISWRQILLNPGVIATSIGFLVLLAPFRLPLLIGGVLADIGTMTLPLSMILIGSLLAGLTLDSFKQLIKNRYIWYATGAKLLLLPMYLIPFLWLPVSTTVMGVAILVTATPTAPTVPMFAQKYNGDVSFATVTVATTTILCVITIPLLYAFILFVR
ncbi:malate permease [Halalkalibacter wakoensis JCM 9140]|uniref:Malate permease n=1 Tax=Halalkalibacter wakoensis JCM 9140 TaxID=1236970 RepID=W4Q174_9BACI|nr:AEC family transporter [Halalkalibacter wakoensis]GAE25443.1 malate permease [Halalkalibacter wakoensis JCM 9140]